MTCPKCGGPLTADVGVSGGCQGHGPEEYCYCSSPDVTVDFVCTGMITKEKPRRKTLHCNYTVRVIHDRYSLERYLNDNYKPSKDPA